MDYKKFIVDSLIRISGRQNEQQVFRDWIEMMSISIFNNSCLIHDEAWSERESRFINIGKKYSQEEFENMGGMLQALIAIFEERYGDILGEIYMETGSGSKNTGQFFTPYNLSLLMAKTAFRERKYKDGEIIRINEPSSGSGGGIIAMANILRDNGINYQRQMYVVAQDLDWNAVYMTYIQLSLLGIKAIVVQGDTLTEPYKKGYDKSRVLMTPAKMGALI